MENRKIVVVEDEAIVAKDISTCLERIGYKVLGVFARGEKALEFIENNLPDIVLMDIMLTGKMNGIEVATQIKEKHNIPVVFLTAYADENTINKAKVAEPFGYVIKPFKEIDLRTSVEMALYKFKKFQEKLAGLDTSEFKRKPTLSKEFIYIKSNSKLIKVINNNILFIEALKDYVIIHTKEEKFTIHSTMIEIEKKLPSEMFMRIHRSYIVNLKKIKSIENSIVIIEDTSKRLPIGGSYRDDLFNQLNLA